MKKTLKIALPILCTLTICCFVAYVFVAFTLLNFDIREWSIEDRVSVIGMGVLFAFGAATMWWSKQVWKTTTN